MMYCRKCKAEIPDASLFCNVCGAKQIAPSRGTRHRRSNGEGTVYKRGNYWQAEVVIGITADGKRDRRYKYGFRTKKEALEYIPTLRSEKTKHLEAARTLKYYHDTIEKTDLVKLSKSKQTAYRIAWGKLESIHDTPVSALTIVQLRDLVCEIAPTFYTARDVKTLLSKIFELAIADQQIMVNMADHITLPALEEKEQTPWNNDELSAIWKAYDEEEVVASYLLLMIYTGMMPGELMKCTREMINLESRQIVGAGLKTDVRKATPIVLPDIILPVIERILTFTEDVGEKHILWMERSQFYDAYHDFTKAAGIRDLPMYSCRHTTATALAVGTDVAPSIIQKIMRHAKFTTTQRYIHPNTADALTGINKLKR